MSIRNFICDTLRRRADRSGALVIYDPSRRLSAIVRELADEKHTVVDASASYIEAYEQTLAWVAAAGDPSAGDRRLFAYVPMQAPTTDEARCHEPFSGIAAGFDCFGASDEDSFQSLCERAKPEQKERIRELFAQGEPTFAALEAVGGGKNWPQLQTLLGVESATEILVAILDPSPDQERKLKTNDWWIGEAKDLLENQFGYTAKTQIKKLDPLRDEAWRLVLFSEFVFDLPHSLPPSLAGVAVAKPAAESFVNRVCEILRQESHHNTYIERADRIAQELGLEDRVREVEDLGVRDTFAFEERSFLRQYVGRLLDEELGKATEIAALRKESVWVKHTDRGALWVVAERAREVLVTATDVERDLAANSKSIDDLLSFYCSRGYRLDQTHRELEKAVADTYGATDGLEELLVAAGTRFHAVAERLQQRFIAFVIKEGWPLPTRLRATQVFDRIVAPLLQNRGKRVAVFFVDALRYELGVALDRQLAGSYPCRLQTVCAQLPTITAVGMAALLPRADGNLFLQRKGDLLEPTISQKPIRNPAERFAYVQEFYGDRARLVDLDDLIAASGGGKKKQIPFAGVELLLVKTTDIDEQGEIDATNVCLFLPHVLSRLIAAIGKLKRLGFHHVVISTDHGFVLHSDVSAGNTVSKPPGDWIQVKDRCLLGSGSATPDTHLFSKEQVGVPGDFSSFVVPKSFATFTKRHPYFHEGLSLQENVIPLLEIDLGNSESQAQSPADVQLRYRGQGAATITTRRPILDVSVFGDELFATEITFRLEARAQLNGAEAIVGEAASCQYVNAATGLVTVKAGFAVKVPMRIIEDFTGLMEVRAVDAETGIVYGLPLKLKLEILV